MERSELLKKLCSAFIDIQNEQQLMEVYQKVYSKIHSLEMETIDQSYSPAEEFLVIENVMQRLGEAYPNPQSVQEKFNHLHQKLQPHLNVAERTSSLIFLLNLLDSPNSEHKTPVSRHASYSTTNQDSEVGSNSICSSIESTNTCARVAGISLASSSNTPSTQLDMFHTPFSNQPLASSSVKEFLLERMKETKCKNIHQKHLPLNDTTIGHTDFMSEQEIILCLIYCFMGKESKAIKYDNSTGGFKLDPAVRIKQTSIVLQLLELGSLHRFVKNCIETAISTDQGIVARALAHAIRKEINHYYHDLASVHVQVESFGDTCDTPLADENNLRKSKVTLRQLLYWSSAHLRPFRFLAGIFDSIEGIQGGEIASHLAIHVNSGSPTLHSLVTRLLAAATKPLYDHMCQWMIKGELYSLLDDFFVEQNHEVDEKDMWDKQFVIKDYMVPEFMSRKQAEQVLQTGQYIHFLHNVCGKKPPLTDSQQKLKEYNENDIAAGNLLSLLHEDGELGSLIENACNECSKLVLHSLNDNFNFKIHFEALRKYMLLGQGDFVHRLMKALETELNKTASSIDQIGLHNSLEMAIRSTNAQYEEENILSRLHINLLEPFDTDTGWDTFSLGYKLDGPLNAIFKLGSGEYSRIFTFLWRIKRAEYFLSRMWCDMTLLFKRSFLHIPEIRLVFMLASATTKSMLDFVNHFQYYMAFEVVEVSWLSFQKEVIKMESLDKIVYAHNAFIENIQRGCMLNNDEMKKTIRYLLDYVLELIPLVEILLTNTENELNTRKEYENKINLYGTSNKEEAANTEKRASYNDSLKNSKSRIRIIAGKFQEGLCTFLTNLADNENYGCQILGHQIDFNEYYKKHNERLNHSFKFGTRFDFSCNFTFNL